MQTKWVDRDAGGSTALHRAVKEGNLDGVPREVFTAENMLVKNEAGWTVIHEAAFAGNLDRVPKEALMREHMVSSANDCSTPLHWAAYTGHLDQVPTEFLTLENLMVENAAGQSVLLWVSINGNLDQLLGVELPSEIIPIVGKEWYSKNVGVCECLRKSKEHVITVVSDAPEIDIF